MRSCSIWGDSLEWEMSTGRSLLLSSQLLPSLFNLGLDIAFVEIDQKSLKQSILIKWHLYFSLPHLRRAYS